MISYNEKEAENKNINWPRPRHGHKYTEYKICLFIMIVICIEQHLSSILSSIYDKVKQHWDWVEKKHCSYKIAGYF